MAQYIDMLKSHLTQLVSHNAGAIAIVAAIFLPLIVGVVVSLTTPKRIGPDDPAVTGVVSQSGSSNVTTPASNGGGQRQQERATIMAPPAANLKPPKTDPFTLESLRTYDGTDPALPIYVSIKGTVFDVTHKRDVYGPPKGSYRLFAGKDASRAFGMSSLKEEDAVPDWSTLEPKEKKVLDDWFSFFRKRYNVVGRVIDMPDSVRKYVWSKADEA